MGVGYYADRSSVQVEKYAPPKYQLAINVVGVEFSDEYWRRHETYIGGSLTNSFTSGWEFEVKRERRRKRANIITCIRQRSSKVQVLPNKAL